MSAVMTGLLVATGDDCTGECEKAGPWGLAIILVLCVICYFLFKSMSRHLKKVRQQFPTEPEDQAPTAPAADEAPVGTDEPTVQVSADEPESQP
jgi:hypothetical protein